MVWDYRLVAPDTPQLRIFNKIGELDEFMADDLIALGFRQGTVYRLIEKLLKQNMVAEVRRFPNGGKGGPQIRVFKVIK